MGDKDNLEDNQENLNTEDNSDTNVSNETSDQKDNSQDDANSDTYKKRYSDSSREAKHVTQVHKAYRQVLKDNSYFLELDEDLAKDVLIQLHEDGYSSTDSYDELVKIISGDDVDEGKSTNPHQAIDEEALSKKIRADILAEQQQEKAQEILDESLSKFSDEVKESYLKEFKETIGKRKLTPELAKKEIEKIIIYNNRDQIKKERDDDALGRIASNGLGGSKSTSQTTMTVAKLDAAGMPKARQRALYPELFPKK